VTAKKTQSRISRSSRPERSTSVKLPPFQLVLDRHRDEVHRFLLGVVGPTDADDCFQETFLSALRAYPDLRDGSNLRSWIMTIAYRKAMDAHRSRARRAIPVGEIPEHGNGRSFDDAHALWQLVGELPGKQRAAVVQRYANGLAYREIAGILECSEEAARQSVREGLKKLKEMAT
jgi:RNA polymerase sigma factor (sigma-70 family)